MGGWLALSDAGAPAAPAGGAAGLWLVLEFALPLRAPGVLLDWREGGAALSVFADPATGVSVLLRQGAAAARHRIMGALRLPAEGVARIALGWSGDGSGWVLRLEAPGTGLIRGARGRAALLPAAAVLAGPFAARGVARHPAVLWYGLAEERALAPPGPWIAAATPVETPEGPCPAGALRPGQWLASPEGPVPVLAVRTAALPAAGSLSPIRLRAPFVARGPDLIVSPRQAVLLSGVSVEYLFGEDMVAAEARQLTDGRSARPDPRAGGVQAVMVQTGGPPFIAAGCLLAAADHRGARLLADWEAVPLRLALEPWLRGRAA